MCLSHPSPHLTCDAQSFICPFQCNEWRAQLTFMPSRGLFVVQTKNNTKLNHLCGNPSHRRHCSYCNNNDFLILSSNSLRYWHMSSSFWIHLPYLLPFRATYVPAYMRNLFSATSSLGANAIWQHHNWRCVTSHLIFCCGLKCKCNVHFMHQASCATLPGTSLKHLQDMAIYFSASLAFCCRIKHCLIPPAPGKLFRLLTDP